MPVSIQWLAAPPSPASGTNLPVVALLSTIHPLPLSTVIGSETAGSFTGVQFDTWSGTYDAWIQATAAQAYADGLNVCYIDTRDALGNDASDYHDAIHPNQTGYGLMAAKIVGSFPK